MTMAIMKYGACEYGSLSRRRCRKTATHLVTWKVPGGDRPLSMREFRCKPHADELAALLEARGKQPTVEVLA